MQASGTNCISAFALEEVMFDGKPGGLDTCRDPELVVDRLHVYVDGIGTQDELLGNLMAGQPLSDQAQHFNLAPGQASGRSQCWGL